MAAVNKNDGFYDATRARQVAMGQASGTNVVLTEINALQLAIDTAASGGSLEYLTVGNTTMTNSAVVNTNTVVTIINGVSTTKTITTLSSEDYFNAWNDPYTYGKAIHILARETMNYVINYFSQLGYSINRRRDGTTNHFNWTIKW